MCFSVAFVRSPPASSILTPQVCFAIRPETLQVFPGPVGEQSPPQLSLTDNHVVPGGAQGSVGG